MLYNGVRDRLRDPEREVRQHALRVLGDLIPVTQTPSLESNMRMILPDLVLNLCHSAPALRKSALDSLRKYLEYSRDYDKLLLDLVESTEDNIICAAPFLISSGTADETLKRVIDQLWEDMNNPQFNHETTAKSLARIRYTLGDERFKALIGNERYAHLQKICDSYGLPIDYCDDDSSNEKVVWSSEEVTEDKVILETEITLKTGPAITMKIHEERRPSSVLASTRSSEDERFVLFNSI